jgi:hypothetical protein
MIDSRTFDSSAAQIRSSRLLRNYLMIGGAIVGICLVIFMVIVGPPWRKADQSAQAVGTVSLDNLAVEIVKGDKPITNKLGEIEQNVGAIYKRIVAVEQKQAPTFVFKADGLGDAIAKALDAELSKPAIPVLAPAPPAADSTKPQAMLFGQVPLAWAGSLLLTRSKN